MWNEKLEARAAKIRARFTKMAELLRRQTPAGQKATRTARIAGLTTSWEQARKRGNAHRNQVVEIATENTQAGKHLRDPRMRVGYPACPRCEGARPEDTIRQGLARGIQRYRCTVCRKTFSGPTVAVKLEPQDYEMICYHCGSNKTTRQGRGMSESRTGRMGLCLKCNKKFVQGGLHDFQRYHLVLEQRIMELNLPEDVECEVLQIASMDVLTGKGYCWSVVLKPKEAFKNCRGEWGQQGSNHPKFREQMGQPKYDRQDY